MALIRASAPLERELTRLLPSRPFNVRFWDGGRVGATEPGSPTFSVRRPAALSHFLRAPGSLGLGRAYVDGSLAVDDLDAAAARAKQTVAALTQSALDANDSPPADDTDNTALLAHWTAALFGEQGSLVDHLH